MRLQFNSRYNQIYIQYNIRRKKKLKTEKNIKGNFEKEKI